MQYRKTTNKPPKVLISGYYGFNNFGDEAVLSVLINNLRNAGIEDINVLSKNPQLTEKTYNVKSANSFDFKQVIFSIIKTKFLISGGGSLLQDKTSLKSLIYYLMIITFSLIIGKKVIIFAQGIGPINNKFFKNLTAFILKRCTYITVRDEKSLSLLKNKGIKADIVSDPVWNIELKRKFSHHAIGIQLREWEELTDKVLNEWAEYIAEFYKDKIIFIYALQESLDIDICNKFERILKKINPDLHTHVVTNRATFEIITAFSHIDELISMRYHACLLGLRYGVRVLPIIYDPKVEKLADEFNIKSRLNLTGETHAKEKIYNLRYKDYYADLDKVSEKVFDFKKFEQILYN